MNGWGVGREVEKVKPFGDQAHAQIAKLEASAAACKIVGLDEMARDMTKAADLLREAIAIAAARAPQFVKAARKLRRRVGADVDAAR
jgi:hypothetical protein